MPEVKLAQSSEMFDLKDDQLVTETNQAAMKNSLEEFESFDDVNEKSKQHLE